MKTVEIRPGNLFSIEFGLTCTPLSGKSISVHQYIPKAPSFLIPNPEQCLYVRGRSEEDITPSGLFSYVKLTTNVYFSQSAHLTDNLGRAGLFTVDSSKLATRSNAQSLTSDTLRYRIRKGR